MNPSVTAVILAGGQGRRMGGLDKGLQSFQGKPLIEHVLARVRPQVAEVMINANRHLDDYRRYGLPVWPDAQADFPGPLAGMLVGLTRSHTPYLLVVPCDMPQLPLDLVERLMAGLISAQAEIAVAVTQGEVHAVCCLMQAGVVTSLQDFLAQGGSRVQSWLASRQLVQVSFDDVSPSFINLNTLQALQSLIKTGCK